MNSYDVIAAAGVKWILHAAAETRSANLVIEKWRTHINRTGHHICQHLTHSGHSIKYEYE